MAARRTRNRRKHRWLKWAVGGLLLALFALGVLISVALRRVEPMMRAAIVQELEDHFHARVELDSFHVSLVNGLWAEGKGLRIWPPAQVEGVTVPGPNGAVSSKPLIEIADFRFHAPLHYKPGKPIRISVVELKGLVVDVPPKPHFTRAAENGGGASPEKRAAPLFLFAIGSIECKGAHLTLETSKPGKLPLEFTIAHLKMTQVSVAAQMHFDAELTNPRPAGTIVTSGNMGPWAVEDPGETPLEGEYRFEHADLGVFKGIAGILDSTGRYQGVLRGLTVDGQTETPDFRLTHFGTALPLHTVFHATVDGTNGDTWLQPVNATLGQSRFTAEGKIVGVPAGVLPNGAARPGGHEIALNVTVSGGRVEDFLRLVSKSGTPLLTGTLSVKTTVEIPPGPEPVHERIKLNGKFVLADAAFTSAKIQKEIGDLSLRSQGKPKDAKSEGVDVRSAMQSDFTMAAGVVTLPDLEYTVPGAGFNMKGTYGVNGGALDFNGTAKMQATVSEMVGGWKGALLKPADKLFEKGGAGTEVGIRISGTEADPKFEIDLGGMKHTRPAIPGQPQ